MKKPVGPIVKRLQLGPMANFVYLLGDEKSETCAVVDPAWDVPAILKAAQEMGWTIARAIVTHRHPDHINGVAALLRARDIPVHIHDKDAHALDMLGDAVKPSASGDRLALGKSELQLIHTPGHTEGSQCVLTAGGLFSGDTLFIGSCGRVDFEDSDPAKMFRSLKALGKLADSTILYPGHHYGEEPEIELGKEKKRNPYLKTSIGGALPDFLELVGA